MNRKLTLALALLLLASLACGAALASVAATPNQQLSLRSGPNTAYTSLGTMPRSTPIRAIEYESGNGVTWVLIEYTRNGRVCRGYTGLKRMTVHGDIPWAEHDHFRMYADCGLMALSAPSANAEDRGRINGGAAVDFLCYDGKYAYIEFNDHDTGTPVRGYVEAMYLSTD